MSALEDSLRKVYKLPQVGTSARGIDAASSFLQKAQEKPELQNTPEFQVATAMIQQNQPRLMDGSPLPEGMVPGPTRTMEYRDANQNGIEDRSEGIYLPKDLVPASSIPQMTEAQKEYQRRFFVLLSFEEYYSLVLNLLVDKCPQIDQLTFCYRRNSFSRYI